MKRVIFAADRFLSTAGNYDVIHTRCALQNKPRIHELETLPAEFQVQLWAI
jgi:hypothetical protein